MEEKISIRKFAKQLGIAETSIRKAIESERIVKGVIKDESGRPWILPDIAKAEYLNTHDPDYKRRPEIYEKLKQEAGKEETNTPSPTGQSTAELKRMLSEIRVQKESIELRKAKGELVDKKKVYAQLFTMGQEMRATFQAIPDRVIDSILAAKDRNEAHNILSLAISEALTQLAEIQKRDIA